MRIEFVTWPLMAVMMAGWAWMQYRKGELSDKQYLWFSLMMIGGQVGGSIDCYFKDNPGMVFIQIYFMLFTLWGAFQRYCDIRAKNSAAACD